MIVEMQSWRARPGAIAAVEERMEKALPARASLSKPAAFWRTETGVLNTFIGFWPYANLAERERVSAATAGIWPPAELNEFVVEQDVKILIPAPFNPPFKEQTLGPLHEIRPYSFVPGSIPGEIERWGKMVPERSKLSPFIGCFYSEIGPMNQWISIWAYADAAERQRIRIDAVKQGIWPPKSPPGTLLKQESMLVIPLKFSPLR